MIFEKNVTIYMVRKQCYDGFCKLVATLPIVGRRINSQCPLFLSPVLQQSISSTIGVMFSLYSLMTLQVRVRVTELVEPVLVL